MAPPFFCVQEPVSTGLRLFRDTNQFFAAYLVVSAASDWLEVGMEFALMIFGREKNYSAILNIDNLFALQWNGVSLNAIRTMLPMRE